MSWIDKLNSGRFVITTGDGKSYTPLWMEAKKNINFNTEGFDFIGKQGTYVQREEVSGTQFPLVFYFTGEDNIDVSNAFEISARDKRPWRIKHPFYGDITAQPLSIEIDDSDYNVSKFTCVVWETLDVKYPGQTQNISGEIELLQEQINELSLNDISNVAPDSSDAARVDNAVNDINKKYSTLATTQQEAQELKNKFREASGAIQNFLNDVNTYIVKTQALINFPFQTKQTVELKFTQIYENILSLGRIFIPEKPTQNNLRLYDTHATSSLTASCVVLSTPEPTDYNTRADVVRSINSLNELYDYYKSLFDEKQYNQDPDISLQVDSIVNKTLANLYDIAFNSRQERTIILGENQNMIVLAHKYFGVGDENIQNFIDLNQIELSEYLQIKKGRKIKYLV